MWTSKELGAAERAELGACRSVLLERGGSSRELIDLVGSCLGGT